MCILYDYVLGVILHLVEKRTLLRKHSVQYHRLLLIKIL